MLIGIDGNEANIEKRVGVNVYTFDLLWSIYKLQKKMTKDTNPIKFQIFLKNMPLADLPKETSYWKYKVLSGRGVWILTKLLPHLWKTKEKPSVFFTPSHYLPPLTPMPKVCSIMDLGYLKFSGQFKKYDYWQLRVWSAISILVSKRIITISNSSKRDIVRHYPFASKKTSVTHLAYDKGRFNTEISKDDVRRTKNKYSIVGDYVLFISTLKPSKNVEGLLDAWSKIVGKSEVGKLVIAGKRGWFFDSVFEKVKKLNLEDSVIFTDYIDEGDKPALIAGAKVFVLPSFWEGFGLDPLYAMACGVPAVVSKVGSLPEVVGKAGLYFDPYDSNDIAQKLLKVLRMSTSGYNKLVNEGLRQASKFSWEKTARKTLKVITTL